MQINLSDNLAEKYFLQLNYCENVRQDVCTNNKNAPNQ